MGDCLKDEPGGENKYEYPELPVGAMYNTEIQCQLQFGPDAKVCSSMSEICSRLWCEVNGNCTTQLRPAAPGTHCGKHMVNISIIKPTHRYVIINHHFVQNNLTMNKKRKMNYLIIFSGVSNINAYQLWILRYPLMVVGASGVPGISVQERAEQGYLSLKENVTIRVRQRAVNFV